MHKIVSIGCYVQIELFGISEQFDLCYPPSELLRGTVRAVIDYVQSGYRSFTFRQECDVKRFMNSQPDKEKAAGTVYKTSLPFLKADECERVKGQLSDIAQDTKEEHQQSRGRRYHM